MLALGSSKPFWKISHIFAALLQTNSWAIPNFIIYKILHTEPPVDIAVAFIILFSTHNNDNLPHSEIHLVPTSSRLSSISSQVAGITVTRLVKCAEPSHRPEPDGIPKVVFRKCGLYLSLLLLDPFLLFVRRYISSSKQRNCIVVQHQENCSLHDLENFRPIIHTLNLSGNLKMFVRGELVNFLTNHDLISPSTAAP